MKRIIIATIKSWNIHSALEFKNSSSFSVEVITDHHDLNIERIDRISPDWIFFPHWSWYIPNEIFEKYRCVVFHTSSLPYGRGGSPIQNQIIRKKYNSQICALKVVNELDAGPVYLREQIDLSKGNLEDIFHEIKEKTFYMIGRIIHDDPIPIPQDGLPVIFKRRNEKESVLPLNPISLNDIYDHIRMLDGEGYPNAYLEYGKIMIKLTKVNYGKTNKLIGNFEIEICE